MLHYISRRVPTHDSVPEAILEDVPPPAWGPGTVPQMNTNDVLLLFVALEGSEKLIEEIEDKIIKNS